MSKHQELACAEIKQDLQKAKMWKGIPNHLVESLVLEGRKARQGCAALLNDRELVWHPKSGRRAKIALLQAKSPNRPNGHQYKVSFSTVLRPGRAHAVVDRCRMEGWDRTGFLAGWGLNIGKDGTYVRYEAYGEKGPFGNSFSYMCVGYSGPETEGSDAVYVVSSSSLSQDSMKALDGNLSMRDSAARGHIYTLGVRIASSATTAGDADSTQGTTIEMVFDADPKTGRADRTLERHLMSTANHVVGQLEAAIEEDKRREAQHQADIAAESRQGSR
jgi:hypothetical protein